MIIERFSTNEILKIESLTENEFFTMITEINVGNEYLKTIDWKGLGKCSTKAEI